MSGDLEDMRTYARGYQDGRRSKDADHAAVAIKLSRLTFDGNHHGNLSKIAYAIYPCATGWTCESAKGLRDRLIDLLGGVHEHRCGTGRGCACGNRDSGDSGEPAKAMTCDVLGNERHKAVCRLREIHTDAGGFVKALANALGVEWQAPRVAQTIAEVRDRLIYLLGGDEPDLQKSPIFEDSAIDDAGKITITDELRKFATDPLLGYASQELHVERITAIADRIDEQFGHIYHQQGAVLQSAISHLIEECNKLHAECDQLRAKLEEADAAIANWRERERSFEESERERDELRRSLRQIAEWAGLPHDRDLSEYSDERISNAVIAQLGQTNQYVKSLEWVRDRRLPRIEAERDELKAKLDAIREELLDEGKFTETQHVWASHATSGPRPMRR